MHEYETLFRHLKLDVSARKCLRPTYSTMPFQSNQISYEKTKIKNGNPKRARQLMNLKEVDRMLMTQLNINEEGKELA